MPMLKAYQNQVEAFYNSLTCDRTLQFGMECWRTDFSPIQMSDEELKKEIDSGAPSRAALEVLRKKANL